MAEKKGYDLVIIGAGPGGYVAAIRASQLGLKVCVIEKDNVGGVCLNWGCIPSKNLIHQAEIFSSCTELTDMGVLVNPSTLDYAKVQQKSRKIIQPLINGVQYLLKKNKVDLIKGRAALLDKNTVVLNDGANIKCRNVIIATGSRPAQMPGFEFDGEQILSSNDILSMEKLPNRLAILGAGAIGCEFAYIMNSFGVKVTLVEMANHILPLEDNDTAALLAQSFKKHGINVMTNTRAVSLEWKSNNLIVNMIGKDEKEKQIETEKVLCVFGRTPNTEGVGLDAIGLQTVKGFIPVGDYYQTEVPGIYAIGDVVATPQLAHVASKEGEIAVEYIAGLKPEPRIDVNTIPSAIYCNPQVASFGVREEQALKDDIPFKKAIFPYQGAGKAVAIGKTEGMVKCLYNPDTNEILGAHILGCDATEIIHEILLAKQNKLLPENIAMLTHAHPTLSETIMECMRAVCEVISCQRDVS